MTQFVCFCSRKMMRLGANFTIKHSICQAIIALSVVALAVVSGCQSSSKPAENRLESILSSEPGCSAPCWRSLQPGSSTEREFLHVVDASDSRLFDDVGRTELRPEGIEYTWEDKEYNNFGRVRIHDDRINLLGFRPLKNILSLSMITDAQGQPSAYGASILGSHDFYVKLNLVYESSGLIVEANFPIDSEKLEVVSTTCEFDIDWATIPDRLYIYLVEPGTEEELVKNDPIGGFTNPSHQPQPWEDKMPITLTQCP